MAEVDPAKLAETEREISKNLVLACVIPIFAWHGFFQQDDYVSIWFQRSGSLTVLLAGWAEYKIFKLRDLTNPISDVGITWQDLAHQGVLCSKHGKVIGIIDYIFKLLIVIGTLIWGYGDLLVEYFDIMYQV